MRRPTFLAQAGFLGGVFFTFLFYEFFFVFSESEHKLGIMPVLQIAPLGQRYPSRRSRKTERFRQAQ
jgi:hypothetical protein